MQNKPLVECVCGLFCETRIKCPHLCSCGCHAYVEFLEKVKKYASRKFQWIPLSDTETLSRPPRALRPLDCPGLGRTLVETLLAWTGKTEIRILYDSDRGRGLVMDNILVRPSLATVVVTRNGGVYGVYSPQGIPEDGLLPRPSPNTFLFCLRQEEGTEKVMTPCRWMIRDHVPDYPAVKVEMENVSPRWDETTLSLIGKRLVFEPMLQITFDQEREWMGNDHFPMLTLRGPETEKYYGEDFVLGKDVYCLEALFDGVTDDMILAPQALGEANSQRLLCLELN